MSGGARLYGYPLSLSLKLSFLVLLLILFFS
jgi:hypothetical protein